MPGYFEQEFNFVLVNRYSLRQEQLDTSKLFLFHIIKLETDFEWTRAPSLYGVLRLDVEEKFLSAGACRGKLFIVENSLAHPTVSLLMQMIE